MNSPMNLSRILCAARRFGLRFWHLLAQIILPAVGVNLAIALPASAQFANAIVIDGGQVGVFQLTADQFDGWVFNGQVNGKQWEPQLKSQLNTRIDYVDQICKLTEAQKQKLSLAGRHDIKRFADQYESLKQKLVNTTYGQDQVNLAYQQVQPLQQTWNAGIFGENSLLYKVLPKVLGAEQNEKYRQEELKRRKFRYMAKVKLSLAALENSLPFTAKQRQQLEELILAETPPPRRWGQYDHQVVLLQASKLPNAKLKQIFNDDAQLQRLKDMLAQAQGMEPMLRQQGWIEDAK
jgi:hypothetical protein